MLYPILSDCPTQPLVTMRNITLKNIDFEGSLLSPGIIRCNETNPCTDFKFENVHMNAWYDSKDIGFISENVYGTVIDSYPDPKFMNQSAIKEEGYNKQIT